MASSDDREDDHAELHPPRRTATLTLEQLRADIADGTVDTVIVAFTDMQGRLQGKRLHGALLPRPRRSRHGTEGCNYLLAVDVDMNTVDGYAISSWERGYGDMEFVHGPRHPAPAPLALPATAMIQCDLVVARRLRPVAASRRAASSGASSTGSPSDGLGRLRRHRARVHPLRGLLRGGLAHRGYRDLDPRQPVQRRLLDPRHQPGRAAAARHPQRHVRAPGMTSRGQGRVQLRPARDRLPLRRRAAHRDNHIVYKTRREGDRGPARPVPHVHGEVRRARGQLVPHPPVAAGRRRRRGLRRRRARAGHASELLRPLHRRACSPRCASFTLLLRAEHQLLQALRRRAPSPRPRSAWGPTTGPARCALVGHGRRRSDGEPGPRRRRQPLPRARRDDRRWPARHRGGARPGAAMRRQRLRRSDYAHVPTTLRAGPRRSSPRARSPGPRSATRSSTTTSTWPTSSSRRSTPRSPTGSASEASRGCEHPTMSTTTHDVINPATEEVVTTIDLAGRRARPTPPSPRAARSSPPGAPSRPADRGHAPAPVRRRRRGAPRGARAARGPQRRAHHRQRALGGGQRPRRACNYYAAAPERLFGRQIPVAGGARRDLPRAARRRRDHRALELPDADRGLGLRPGAGRRQHRGPQAGRADPADRDPDRRAGARGRDPRGRPHGAARQGLGRRRAVRHAPRRPQGLLHRLDRRRQADHGRLRRPGEAGDARARRQERQHRLRRRRPRHGRRQPPRCGVFDNAGQDCCARSRILVQRSVYDAFMERLRDRPCRTSWSATPATRPPQMGPLVSRRASARRCAGTSTAPTGTTPSTSPSAARAPDGAGWWYPPTVVASRAARRSRSGARRSSGRSSR